MPSPRRTSPPVLVAAVAVLAATLASCSDERTPPGTFAERLCPSVVEWANSSVKTANVFQEGSPGLSPEARKASYVAAFGLLEDHLATWEQSLDDLTYDVLDGEEVHEELLAAVALVRDEYDFDVDEAEGLPLDAYDQQQVSGGSLFTGVEKAKAIVFRALGRIWIERGLVDENCGRRPPVSINLGPG